MIYIGITGTNGAGKGVVVDYLRDTYGFKHYSVRAYLIGEIEKRGLPVNRDTMNSVSTDIRMHTHPAFIIEELVRIAESDKSNHAIFESIRLPLEVDCLRKHDPCYLLAVDADQRTRYERITERKSSTDDLTFERFVFEEEREMSSTDPNKHSIHDVMMLADYTLYNNTTLEELYKQVDTLIKPLL